jgi:hypothetical protein
MKILFGFCILSPVLVNSLSKLLLHILFFHFLYFMLVFVPFDFHGLNFLVNMLSVLHTVISFIFLILFYFRCFVLTLLISILISQFQTSVSLITLFKAKLRNPIFLGVNLSSFVSKQVIYLKFTLHCIFCLFVFH